MPTVEELRELQACINDLQLSLDLAVMKIKRSEDPSECLRLSSSLLDHANKVAAKLLPDQKPKNFHAIPDFKNGVIP